MKKLYFLIGVIVGGLLFGGIGAVAVSKGIIAVPSPQSIYVDGRKTEMTAYSIEDNNYVRLRDIGKAVDFSVEYDDVTDSVYIGKKSYYHFDESAFSEREVISKLDTRSDLYFKIFVDLFHHTREISGRTLDDSFKYYKYVAVDLSKVKREDRDAVKKEFETLCKRNGVTLLLKTFEELKKEEYIRPRIPGEKDGSYYFADGFLVDFQDVPLSDDVTKISASVWWAGLSSINGDYIVREDDGKWILLAPSVKWLS